MIKAATLQPRKYTVRRIRYGADEESKSYHQFNEADESVIAHIAFVYQSTEGFNAQFYRVSPDGDPYLYRSITKVLIVDEGVPVSEGEAA